MMMGSLGITGDQSLWMGWKEDLETNFLEIDRLKEAPDLVALVLNSVLVTVDFVAEKKVVRSILTKGSGAFGASAGGFRRREGSEGGFGARPQAANFDRRPSDAVAPAPALAKSKSNPFGNAAPRDENAIQQAIEERRKEREAAKEAQRLVESKARAEIESKSKSNREERPKKEDTVPQAAGSWRRAAGVKPAFPPKAKDDSKGELFGKGKKPSAFTSRKEEFEQRTTEAKPKRKVDSSTANIFDALPSE
jgi:hypothetical protein